MSDFKFVILGGGMVAGYSARQMVDLGLKSGQLAIVSADDAVPYERPPLSKGFLAGKDREDSIRINPADFYREKGIELRLQTEVASVDTKRKRLVLKSGGDIGFERLIVATGSRPKKLKIPGANLSGVHYLRLLQDSKSIREAAGKARSAVVLGGGFIGMEVTSVLAQKKIDVTMVLQDDRIWKKFFTPQMSQFFEKYYSDRGVKIVKKASITELIGKTSVESAKLSTGQNVTCQLAVAGIGVEPVTDVLNGSGIAVDNGVTVNEYLETNQSDIFAAGDVANYQDVLFGKRRRVEHWDNAVSQGQYLAETLLKERKPFKHVPYFFSDVFDLSYEYWGDSSEADETIHRGDVTTNSFSVWWLKNKALVAAFTMNRPDEERENAPKWIEEKQSVSGQKLADANKAIVTAKE